MSTYPTATSYNHHILIHMPAIAALPSSSTLSSFFQDYDITDDNINNDTFGVQQPQAMAAAPQVMVAAPQQPEPIVNAATGVHTRAGTFALPVPVTDPIHQQQSQQHHRNSFWFALILRIALYLCPTFIIKPATPLRFRMTLPIVLHILVAFAIFVLILLAIILTVLGGTTSPANTFFRS